ncbi:MAG: DUF5132 domain-containing protein [Mycobacterium sp.]
MYPVVATPLVKPFLAGVVAGPVGLLILKPIFRGVVKATVVVALEAKKLAAEATEEFQDVAAEVSADMAAKSRGMAAKSREAGDLGVSPKH